MTTHKQAMTGPVTYRPECGSVRGWWAHRHASERACQPCRKAVAIGLQEENTYSLQQALDELSNLSTGRRFWNPNLPEPGKR